MVCSRDRRSDERSNPEDPLQKTQSNVSLIRILSSTFNATSMCKNDSPKSAIHGPKPEMRRIMNTETQTVCCVRRARIHAAKADVVDNAI